jgi:hypothetical protein
VRALSLLFCLSRPATLGSCGWLSFILFTVHQRLSSSPLSSSPPSAVALRSVMGRRRPKGEAPPKKNKTHSQHFRFSGSLCSSNSHGDVEHAPTATRTGTAEDAVVTQAASAMLEKAPPIDSDLVAPYPSETAVPSQNCRLPAIVTTAAVPEHKDDDDDGAAARPSRSTGMNQQQAPRRNSRCAEHRLSIHPISTDSEAASAPRRLSRQAPSLHPSLAPLPQQQQLSSPPTTSNRANASFVPTTGSTSDHTNSQTNRPQLKAFPVPDSRLFVFNTQMTSPVPMLVHGTSQHNLVSLGSAHGFSVTASPANHFASPTRVPPLSFQQQQQPQTQGSSKGGATASTTAGEPSPVLPERRRSRPTALVISEPSASAFTRIPPAAPALHFTGFLAESSPSANQGQPDGSATTRGSAATGSGSTTRPASTASLTVSPTLWSSSNTSNDFNANGTASLVPSPPHSRTLSAYSAASNSLYSGSLTSSSSVTSSFDQYPMDGGMSPVPLAEHGLAAWHNGSVPLTPLDVAAAPSQLPSELSTNPVGASILMAGRNSLRSSADMTMGSVSFISARHRKGSCEGEASKEVEIVADFVARMKATKKADANGSRAKTPESVELTDTCGGLTSSSGEAGGTPTRSESVKPENTSRAGTVISLPPAPPLRVSSESSGLARPPRQWVSLDVSSDTPLKSSTPEPLSAHSPPHTTATNSSSPISVSLDDRDATSAGSSRSNSSYRRRDVKASVEAAVANMNSTSSPTPSAASRRKRRDMAVNFLFAP